MPPATLPFLTLLSQIGWVHGEDANTFVKEERPAGQHAEIVFGQRYGDHAPVPALRGVSIPVDYLQSNYPRMLALYLIFFTVPLLISWNYCVVKSHDNGARVFPTTALLVRAPLLFVGFFVGSVFYAIAQGCIILAYTFVVPKGTSQGMPFAILILALGVLFNCLHAGFWIAQVTNHAHLMAFTRYAAEFSTGQIMSEGWSSSLATPLLVFFLSVEPISTAVIHFFAISYTLCCKTYSRGA